MTKPSASIDRATLLKGGGVAALATVLAAAVQGTADACCSPIDLTYLDAPAAAAPTVKIPRRTPAPQRKMTATPLRGLRLWSSNNPPSSYPDASWTLAFSISDSKAYGTDERGHGHGLNGQAGNSAPPQPLGYTILVFTK